MQTYVITISRQFASMGRTIAQIMSQKLGIEYYDRDIVEETSKRLGLSISEVSNLEEGHGKVYAKRAFPLGKGTKSDRDQVFLTQKNIIMDLANKESCIIVGRCAESILSKHPRMLNVFIYASREKRLQNCVNELKMDKRASIKMLDAVDQARERYRREYGLNQDILEGHQIMLDSSRFGIEGSASLLAQVVNNLFI